MRRSALLAGLLAVAACGPRARRVNDTAHGGAPKRIVALGDSLAFGTGASHPERAFLFASYLRVRAQHPGSRIDNLAIPGSTARDVLRLQAPRLANMHADAVIVCVGGNDVVRRVDAESFAGAYAALIARVRTLQPHAALMCCGVPDVGSSPLFTGFDQGEVSRLSRADDRAVATIAARAGATFVDLFAATHAHHGNRFLSDDRFHPNDAGYAVLADLLTPPLLRALNR